MASRVILSNFFEKQLTQNHPQYLSGLSRALFPTTFLEIGVNYCCSLTVLLYKVRYICRDNKYYATLVTLTNEEDMSNFNMGWNVKVC